jgi:Helix-turn-helix domain
VTVKRSQPRKYKWLDVIRKDKRVDRTARAVAAWLARHMNVSGECFVSKQTLVEETGYCQRAVDYAILRLEKLGYLRVNRIVGGRNKANEYHAILPETPHGDAGFTGAETPHLATQNPASTDTKPRTQQHETPHGDAPQVVEAKKKGFKGDGAADTASDADTVPERPIIETPHLTQAQRAENLQRIREIQAQLLRNVA